MSQERRDEMARRMREHAKAMNPRGLPLGVQPDSPSIFSSLDLGQPSPSTHAEACEVVSELFKEAGNPLVVIARLKPDIFQRLELERLAAEFISQGNLLARPVKKYTDQDSIERDRYDQVREREEAVQLAWLEQLGAEKQYIQSFNFVRLRRLDSYLGI